MRDKPVTLSKTPRTDEVRQYRTDLKMRYARMEGLAERLETELAAAQEQIEALTRRADLYGDKLTKAERHRINAEDRVGDLTIRVEEAEQAEAKLAATVKWLEANQPDVFSRGLWDVAALDAKGAPHG